MRGVEGCTLIRMQIDDVTIEAEADQSVLDVARANGIELPALCHHPALKPAGVCHLCAVETIGKSGRPTTKPACVLQPKEGLAVKTTGALVQQARRHAFEHLLAMAPQSQILRDMAKDWGVEIGPAPDGCIRCRLCIRVCREVVGPAALTMEKHGALNYVVPLEGRCIGCGTCVNICPTRVIRVEDRDNVRTISIRDEVIGRHPLERCEGCGALFATPRFLDHIHDRIAPHPDVKDHHQYCPTCSKLFSDRVRAAARRK
jgi:predicted molibdopterin-dependent oxidoreductase YjgC